MEYPALVVGRWKIEAEKTGEKGYCAEANGTNRVCAMVLSLFLRGGFSPQLCLRATRLIKAIGGGTATKIRTGAFFPHV